MSKPCRYVEHKKNVVSLQSKAILKAIKHVKKNHKTRDQVYMFHDSEHALTQLQLMLNGEKSLHDYEKNGLGGRILKELYGVEKRWHR